MKLNADLRDQLAAQYVLGTLSGPARKRMETLMMQDWRVREAVWHWETLLAPLLLRPSPVKAPTHCLADIEGRLFGIPPRRPSLFSVAGWLTAAAASVIALALMIYQPVPVPVSTPQLLAAFAVDAGDVHWSFRTDAEFNQLTARPLEVGQAESASDYELWVLPADGAPLSLGVLKTGDASQSIPLTAQQRNALKSSKLLAISLEPAGGSPTGQPTGPVLYTATFALL